MEDINNIRPAPPRRRKRKTKWQIFKEAYLPVMILTAAFVLIIVFIAGAIGRSNTDALDESGSTGDSQGNQQSQQERDALDALLRQADDLAQQGNYEGALVLLRGYSGEFVSDTTLTGKIQEYTDAYNAQTVVDVTNIPILSFNTLIADITAAGSDDLSGHITTGEFSSILQQLYNGGYVLVSAADLTTGNGDSLRPTQLRLPEGKKPIMLVLTDANYTGAAGFASRLVVDENGGLANEMDQDNGSILVGAYDLIPILTDFVESHPDFTYNNARALIAVSGAQGIFGYAVSTQLTELQTVIAAVKAEGYDFACYTYKNVCYGDLNTAEAEADAALWLENVSALVGDTNVLVYPYGTDFTDISSDEQLRALNAKGFDIFIGTNSSASAWGELTDGYLALTRRWVNAAALTTRADKFADVFDAAKAADPQRDA